MTAAKPHFRGRHYEAKRTVAPVRAANPTVRYIPVQQYADDAAEAGKTEAQQQENAAVAYVWRSRDNRKGRHALAVGPSYRRGEHGKGPRPSASWQQTLSGIGKMFVRYPVWDVSYDVAVIFTIGSIIWVINGFFVWLPEVAPSASFPGESSWGGGLTGFIGATVFELGSILLMLEAVNENRSDCFGWAVEETVDGWLRLHHDHNCKHHHAQKESLLKGSPATETAERAVGASQGAGKRKWSWWPSWHELRTHYIRDIGFLACSFQMMGATVFWISGFTAIPSIQRRLSVAATNGVYWLPQVVGGIGFIVSSILFMVEVQPRWYVPAPRVLGWHIGLWNFIGAIGFTLCGALGFGGSRSGIEYALTLATFIGSWAFLIGSIIQWFESLNKYPIWIDKHVTSQGINSAASDTS